MVKKGRTKKRRAGRYGKTKLKNRSWNRWDPNPKVAKELKEKWDSSKSPAANLESFGLVAKPNQLDAGASKTNNGAQTAVADASSVIELFDVPDSEAKPSLKKRYPLEKEDEEYIAKCMAKWGNNYKSMFLDIKVNDLQHTEQQLRKLGARYLLLTEEQRRVSIPENIRDLLPSSNACR